MAICRFRINIGPDKTIDQVKYCVIRKHFHFLESSPERVYMYVYTWIYENQVALSKGLWVAFGTVVQNLQSPHYKN